MKYTGYLLLALFLVIGACTTATTETTSAPGSTAAAPPTTAATTSSSTTTTTVLTTTSTVAPTTSTSTTLPPGDTPAPFSTEVLGTFPESLPGSDGAAGSGCAPGSDSLPDGAWFGFVVDRTADGVEFDLACWWSGDLANEVALAHGETDVPVPNDFYISNDSDQLRFLDVGTDVPVLSLDYTGSASDPFVLMEFGGWGSASTYLNCDFTSADEPFCLVWLFINDGVVTEMVEQYVP